MMEMIPNIKKLGIHFSIPNCNELDWSFEGEYIYSQKFYHLPNVGNLCQLEKLKLETYGYIYRPQQLNPVFPPSLKKLTLRGGLGLPWEEMTNISLPNLQVLKLRNDACNGECWKTIGGKFGELRLLLIDGCSMQHWETKSSHFPKLECLILYRCPKLFEIPSEIGDIATLKLIEVDMHLLESAKKIQQLSGNDSLQVRTKNRS